MDMVRKVTESLPDSDEQPWGLAALPLKDRISTSIQYVKANAMGMDFLQDTYMAQYRKSGTKVTAFLSRRVSAESARGDVDQYATFAEKYGIALGVDAEWIYEHNKKAHFSKGQIILLGTDGVWEVRNKKGEMLGKEPILNAIRQNSSSDATQIIEAIFDTLDKFIGEVKIEDDITSVVIKMQN
jgi:hypothetical protein